MAIYYEVFTYYELSVTNQYKTLKIPKFIVPSFIIEHICSLTQVEFNTKAKKVEFLRNHKC